MSKKLWSVFTDDMDHCYFTGASPVERHHGVHAGQGAKLIDTKLKTMAQKYFESHYGSREDFRRIFGKSYLG